MKLYVGNLSYDSGEEDIRELFEQFGEVTTVNVITFKDTGRSKGFGFVEMANKEDAEKAIEQLNDTEFQGRSIKVSEARPKSRNDSRRPRNFGGRSRNNDFSGGKSFKRY
ncbi:RNA-binding protein [bacterium B13(2017)]|nr:RNA-binding protein [bacterium B13(2017)]